MRGIVLGLAGQIGSGKSTVAKALASTRHCASVSFGDYVRAEARRRNLRGDRKELQDLGQDLLTDRGAERFCVDVLESEVPEYVPGQDLVVEGVRHVEVARALRKLVQPAAFELIYIHVDQRTRLQRLEVREGEGSLRNADRHDSEREVQGPLRGVADLTLVSTRASGELVRAVLAWCRAERMFWGSAI